MRRSEALTGLSHQHHQGLFAALQLKRADEESAHEARTAFLDFFEREGASHFATRRSCCCRPSPGTAGRTTR